jgi:uncharacterized YccA/Bax inhibitor family protein
MDSIKISTDERETAAEETKAEEREDSEHGFRNPVLKRVQNKNITEIYQKVATTEGASLKSLFLLVLVIAASGISCYYTFPNRSILMMIFGAFITGIYICRNPERSMYLSPVYAVLEGIVLGQISVHEETSCEGIVLQAVLVTFIIAFLTALSYCRKWIRVNEAFRNNVVMATGAIALLYVVDLILIIGFGMEIPMLHDMDWKGIGISLIVIVIAASNLACDFADIDSLMEKGFPSYYEWYFAFAFMVSMIWLYLEILNLFRKVRR